MNTFAPEKAGLYDVNNPPINSSSVEKHFNKNGFFYLYFGANEVKASCIVLEVLYVLLEL